MENLIYPTRSFIKFAARSQLISNETGQVFTTFIQRPDQIVSRDLISPESQKFSALDESEHESHIPETPILDKALDEELFQDLATTLFHPDRHPELYQPCDSVEVAHHIEHRITAELVDLYQQIKRNQNNPTIQALNALL